MISDQTSAKRVVTPPILWSLGVAALIAVFTVGIDTWLAQMVGIIRDGMPYDGVSYAVDAKALHRALSHRGWHALLEHGFSLTFAPFWKFLMLLHFWVFGEGLWQAYFVRVWQVFGFVFLTLWVARRHAGAGFALFTAAVAMMLPTISPNAVGMLNTQITGRYDGSYPYLADLRPDMLHSVLLVLAITLLIERARTPGVSLMLIDGGMAACAILVKSSTAPLTVCVWGAALGYFWWRQRGQRRRLAPLFGSAAVAFIALILPWGLLGGFRTTAEYLTHAALGSSGVFLYGLRDASLGQVLGYYGEWFRYHVGTGAIVALVFLMGLHLARPRLLVSTSSWPDVCAYAAFAVGLYAIVTAETVKNYFLGLPAYLFAWVLLLILAGGVWRLVAATKPAALFALVVAALFSAGASLAYAGRLAAASVPPDYRHNLTVVRRLAADMRLLLSNDDKYLIYWTSDFPGIIDFYLMDRRGKRPRNTLFEAAATGFLMAPSQTTRDRFISNDLVPASVIVMFDNRIDVAEHSIYVPRGGRAVLQLIREYLANPADRMCRDGRYQFDRLEGLDSNGGLTAVLYARCDLLARLKSRASSRAGEPTEH